MASDQDAFGHALWEWAQGGVAPESLERDDGFSQVGAGPEVYLARFRDWPRAERQSLRHASGRVLDVGCGAGRVSLELQGRGVDVVGLDSSPLAVRASRLRGVERVWRGRVEDLGERLRTFDSLVLFGNNFGIFGTPPRARRVLSGLARVTAPDARILVESTNPYCGGAPGLDRSYYRANQGRGRAPGQVRLRFHFERFTGPWFDWLYVGRREMRDLLRGTGWHLDDVVGSAPSEPYVAVLGKDRR